MWKLIFFSVVIVALAIGAIGIKMLLMKNGEFKKSCSSVDPKTGKPFGCTCGKEDGGASCDHKEQHELTDHPASGEKKS